MGLETYASNDRTTWWWWGFS